MYGGAMKARSRGRVTPRGIDHRYLSDAHDRQVLDEARELLEAMAAERELASFLGEPAGVRIANYCHPAGTCAMGSVVDARGQVLGVDDLYVADASVMPTITRGNPNLPTAAIAARIALGLVREHRDARALGRA
jgi:choline dehydrogenase